MQAPTLSHEVPRAAALVFETLSTKSPAKGTENTGPHLHAGSRHVSNGGEWRAAVPSAHVVPPPRPALQEAENPGSVVCFTFLKEHSVLGCEAQ